MRTLIVTLTAAVALAGVVSTAPAHAAAPPRGAAYRPGAVIHAAPTAHPTLAPTSEALSAAAPVARPSLAHPRSTRLRPAPSWVPRIKQTTRANNWSGYADQAVSDSYFNNVSSQWTEPNFTCDAAHGRDGSETSQWIGIDGNAADDPSLEQVGTIEGCRPNGRPYVNLFWETIPGPPHQFVGGAPGDTIQASVTYLGDNEFQLIVTDETRNQSLNVTKPCISSRGCPLASVEAIAEWPGSQLKSGITLTRYGAFPFYNFNATNWYPATGLTYQAAFVSSTLWSSDSIETVGPTPRGRSERVVQAPGALSDGGRAFEQYWRHAY